KHQQRMISLVNIHDKDLLKARSRIRTRERHISSESRKPKRPAEKGINKRTATIKILHAEDDLTVARLLGEIFALQDWKVEVCINGTHALERLSSKTHYDVLIFDQ